MPRFRISPDKGKRRTRFTVIEKCRAAGEAVVTVAIAVAMVAVGFIHALAQKYERNHIYRQRQNFIGNGIVPPAGL